MSNHLVLLGDSIFDNGIYVGGGPDVIAQVREILPSGDRATLLAVDGNFVGDVAAQLRALPTDATHLIISVGGNDALGQTPILDENVSSVAHALSRLSQVGNSFGARYGEMLQSALACNLPTVVCTIYDANFPDDATQRVIKAALTHFNDAILRAAFGAGVPVLDLRAICSERADYANDIEPSSIGGAKIARAILNAVNNHDFSTQRSAIFAN